jgi:hypothetical protein
LMIASERQTLLARFLLLISRSIPTTRKAV